MPSEWREKEFREGIVEGMVEHTIAYQIRENRLRRKWSQAEFGRRIGTKQPGVNRLEDPTLVSCTIGTLFKVAHAFDCALLVRFVPHDVLAGYVDKTKPDDLYVPSYEELQK